MKGLFITFEGIEGSGKTTQIKRLRNWFAEKGQEAIVTREPGGTPISEAIRGLLLNPDHSAMVSNAELLLYGAARAQHVAELIQPSLERGAMILCDRFADSTVAYQGFARGVDRVVLDRLNAFATGGIEPDITLLFDLPVRSGLQRALRGRAADRIERESIAFHEKVREGYLELAKQHPERIHIVNADQSPDAVAVDVAAIVERSVAERGLTAE